MKAAPIFAAQLALVATLVSGSPVMDSSGPLGARDYHIERRDGIEAHIFKRDAVITERDVELADLHGVNLTESKSCPVPRLAVCLIISKCSC